MTNYLGDDGQFHALGSGDVGGLALMPIGGCMTWFSIALPGGPATWAWVNGQAISRTTYATLFALFGTYYGPGDGSTTFNLPDARGRALFGLDNMGGSAAGRITVAGGNFDGTIIGNTGGAQNHTLTQAEMPSHSHTASSFQASHSHTVTPASPFMEQAGGLSSTFTSGNAGGRESTLTTDTQTPAVTTTVNAAGGGGAHSIMPPAIMCTLVMRVL